jgi:glucosamine-6-phosphate deaminase
MKVHIYDSKVKMGKAAAECAASQLNDAIAYRGEANLVLATGASQFEMLASLVKQPVDWSKVTAFHLDEYLGLPVEHPASFRKYLRERFEEKIENLGVFHYVNGDVENPEAECKRLNALIGGRTIDVACIGIGENGHLAFNDPPADFDTEDPYIVVKLSKRCRQQQLGEGWFPSLDTVPTHAISMSIQQILKSKVIVCTVPDARKAEAVQRTLEEPISPQIPASILRRHPQCDIYVDRPAIQKLSQQTINTFKASN